MGVVMSRLDKTLGVSFAAIMVLVLSVAFVRGMYKGQCPTCGGICVNAQGSSVFSDDWSSQCLNCGSIYAKPKR